MGNVNFAGMLLQEVEQCTQITHILPVLFQLVCYGMSINVHDFKSDRDKPKFGGPNKKKKPCK